MECALAPADSAKPSKRQPPTIEPRELLNVEKDSRILGWLMVGQLVRVVISDGREDPDLPEYSDTNTETEHFDEDDWPLELESDLAGEVPTDTVTGRVYSYDHTVKLLILSTSCPRELPA